MDIFTLNPHNFSHFGETGGHNMDFCGIKEASKKSYVFEEREDRLLQKSCNLYYIHTFLK